MFVGAADAEVAQLSSMRMVITPEASMWSKRMR